MDRKAYDYGFRAGQQAASPDSRLEMFIRSMDYKTGYVHGFVTRFTVTAAAAAEQARLGKEYGIPAARLDAPAPAAQAAHDDENDEDD